MAHEAVAFWTETSSDPELIAGVRAGDGTAFGVLYQRHVDAARRVAAQYTNAASDVDDVVAESFSRVLRALQRGDGPDLAFRAYLFTIVRRTGMEFINRGNRTRPGEDMQQYESALGYEAPSDSGALEGFEQGIVADAFRSLPERWQAVLWYTEVEKKSPREIAPLLGLTANGVAALAYRAREALRQAYLQQHLNVADSMDCLAASAQLGAYVRGGLAKREHAKVDDHVSTCAKCAALVGELEDVNRGMRGIIAPLVLGVLGMGALEGGLPIGGVFAASSVAGSASGGAGAGATGGAGAGAGATGSGLAAFVASTSAIVLPAAAALGIVALVVSGASYLGVFDPLGHAQGLTPTSSSTPEPGPTDGDSSSPDPTANPSVSPSAEPTVSPSAEPSVGPSTAPDAGSGVVGGLAGDGGDGGNGGGTDPTPDPTPTETTDPDPEPSETPTVDPTPDPGGGTTTPKAPSLAFGSAPLEYLEISPTSPTVGITLSNAGEGDADDVTASITLPDGLTFAAPGGGASPFALAPAARLANFLSFAAEGSFAAGDWDCTLSEAARLATCTIDAVAAGHDARLELDLAPITDATFIGDDAWTLFTASSGDDSTEYRVRTGIERSEEDLQVGYAASGHLAATQVGATLVSCNLKSESCREVMGTTSTKVDQRWNNNGQKPEPINAAGGERNSASTSLSSDFLPEGATVKYALLEWSANRSTSDTGWSGALNSARLRVPGGAYAAITADSVASRNVDGRIYYQARKDITGLVAAAGRGTYSLADIALTASTKDRSPNYYGGFTITVVYELSSLPQSRVALFTGSQWVDDDSPADFTFFAEGTNDVTLGWTTWEGDRGYAGDTARLDGSPLTPRGWDGTKTFVANPSNAADSTAFGGQWANTLGVDAKSFVTKRAGSGLHTVTVKTDDDTFLIGSLTVTVSEPK